MAVFRIEKTRDYTVMANHHLRSTALPLKSKGFLSLMLSLPEDWDYITKGLVWICKGGVDNICATIKELEKQGYIIHEHVRNSKGQLTIIEYTILEQPKPPLPKQENPALDNPILDSSKQVSPKQGNPAQSNTKRSGNQESNTDLSSTEPPNSIQSNPYKPQAAAGIGMDTREAYREITLESIEYGTLIQDRKLNRDRLNEIVGLLMDTVCFAKQIICISGDDFPAEVARSRLLKLDSSHIQHVFDCMVDNTTYVCGIEKYLPMVLLSAPITIGSYCSALVNHDLYSSGEKKQSTQEGVVQRTIALSIQATRLTTPVLRKALKKLLKSGKNKLVQSSRNKQASWQLIKHNTGISDTEIANNSIKAFGHTAKRYGIDFTLKKDISTYPPRYLVFFKGRNMDMLTAALKEFSAKSPDHEKKPSIRKLFSQMREKVKQYRQREEVKAKDRGQELWT